MSIECFIYEPRYGLEFVRDRVQKSKGIIGASRLDILDKLEEQKIPIRGQDFLIAGVATNYCVYLNIVDFLNNGAKSVTVNCLESRAKAELALDVVLSPEERADTIRVLLVEKADDPRLKFITE